MPVMWRHVCTTALLLLPIAAVLINAQGGDDLLPQPPQHLVIAPCPFGARPMLRPDGQPRKCLPHQNSLCVNALPDRPDAETVCCYHNQVDYYCCLDVNATQCPDYREVTVVIHNAAPHNPLGLRSYFFRDGIEDDLVDAALHRRRTNNAISSNNNNNNNRNSQIPTSPDDFVN